MALRSSRRLPTEDPITEERLPLAELLAKGGDGDFLRSVAEAMLQLLMEADVEGLIGAATMRCSPCSPPASKGPGRSLARAKGVGRWSRMCVVSYASRSAGG